MWGWGVRSEGVGVRGGRVRGVRGERWEGEGGGVRSEGVGCERWEG